MFKATLLKQGDLSPREAEVLCRLCEGLPDKGIARVLGMSIKTVSVHLEHVYQKLDVKKQSVNARCSAIITAFEAEMIQIHKV